MPQEPPPFDPADPFQAMSDLFRRQVIQFVLEAERITIYRDLPADQKLGAIISGTFTGAICAAFAMITPEGRDAIMEYAEECVPHARLQAENMRDKNGNIFK